MDPTLADLTIEYNAYACIDILKLILENLSIKNSNTTDNMPSDAQAKEQTKSTEESYEAYILVEPHRNNSPHIKQLTRLYLTRQMIHVLITKIHDLLECRLKIEAFHPLRTKEIYGQDLAFLQLEKYKNLDYKPEPNFYITTFSLNPYEIESSANFPDYRYDHAKFTVTNMKITPEDIYIRSSGKTMQTLEKSANQCSLENLQPEDAKVINDFMVVVDVDMIKSLTFILDKKWEKRSDEFHILLEMMIAVLVKGEGIKAHSDRINMINYLNRNYPNINPFPYAPNTRLNEQTERLCSMANPNESSNKSKKRKSKKAAKKRKTAKNSIPSLSPIENHSS